MTIPGSKPVARRTLAATTLDTLILREAHEVTAIPMKGRASSVNTAAGVPETGVKPRNKTPTERLLMANVSRKILSARAVGRRGVFVALRSLGMMSIYVKYTGGI